MNIKEIVVGLKKKYKTSNPFEIAKSMNICILYEDLGEIYGYYNNPLRMKQIHINCNLPDHLQTLTCAQNLDMLYCTQGRTLHFSGKVPLFLSTKWKIKQINLQLS